MSFIKTLSTVVVGLAVTQSAQAGFDLKVNERVFNDFPNSTLVTTTGPNSVQFDEGPFGTGGWANRHDVMATSDGGLTDHLFQINEPFSVEANVTLDPTDANAEAGLRLNASITGDVIFLIKNNGEIAAFGGGAPFFSFAAPGDPDAYVPGTPIFMKMVYTPGPGLFQPGSVEYIIDRGNGLESSGVLAWQNLEGGPTNHTVGMYTQYSPTAPETTSHVVTTFNDIVITPEPTSLALMGLGGLAALRRKH
ncbi:MAG: hypothetical protein Kow00105_14790 [Phycisphaeraceae bacterium]